MWAGRFAARAVGDVDVLVLVDRDAGMGEVVLPGAQQRARFQVRPAGLLAQFAQGALAGSLARFQAAVGEGPVDADLDVVVPEEEDGALGVEHGDAGGSAGSARRVDQRLAQDRAGAAELAVLAVGDHLVAESGPEGEAGAVSEPIRGETRPGGCLPGGSGTGSDTVRRRTQVPPSNA